MLPTNDRYELLKIPNTEWSYLVQYTRDWSNRSRPMPAHLKWVINYEPGKYDLAVLHVDQQCLIPSFGKAQVFKDIRSQIHDIPIIVINHATPVYPESFTQMCVADGYPPTEAGAEEWARMKMKELLKGTDMMVVNSHQAQEMWGWGKTIIHGLDPEEWLDLTKEPRVATFISPAGIGDKYYGRELFVNTITTLHDKYGIDLVWIGKEKSCTDWNDYKDFIGKTLVYFNPTYGSPMPRSRTEAMMSGACVVTTRHHDADKFIKNGINGWIVRDNPEDCADKIAEMIFNYKEAVKIGEAGRQTAIEIFNARRFRSEWSELIKQILNK